IERQVEVADDVISALSDFAKLPAPDQQPIDVPGCIEGVLKVEQLPPNIAISVSCPPSLPAMLVDGKQVRIVLGNLVRNARDAMPNGGRLEIRATSADGHVSIAVVDTGVGIAADNLRQIMEPFFSTKARGIGLGLALTRAILDKNKGTLNVSSEPG